MPTPPTNLNEFLSLVQLITDLRGPEGCEWDKQQTHLSLAPYAIEETYEMVEALENGSDAEMCEELGDVLFQVVLHAQLAQERKAFSIKDVIQSISEKIVRRHPHVFSNIKVSGTEEIIKNWDLIKAEEKKLKKIKPTLFSVPKGLPALQTSEKIGTKTQTYQFDWSNAKDAIAHLRSEIIELEEALAKKKRDQSEVTHEMGDILFTAAQVARHLEIEPESSLRIANQRFSRRFLAMISECDEDLQKFISLPDSEKQKLWSKVKKQEL